MDYSESICFSAAPAEMLNKKAFMLNQSLYLFAYYEPKSYYESESNYSKFSTAIINLYGLFWDCGPFVFQLFKSQDSILINDWQRISWEADSLKRGISAFRTLFCHNCSDQFPLNAEKVAEAIYWASRYSYGWQSIDEISEDGWGKLLAGIVYEADSLVKEISIALDNLTATADVSRRDRVVERWIKQIALGYRRNPEYLLNTMTGMYQLYLINSNSMRNNRRDLRELTIEWVCLFANCQSNNWYKKWLEPTELDGSSKDIVNTNLYAILKDWPNKWADWNSCSSDECDEAPMPASAFFRILASDVDQFARNPNLVRSASSC